MKTITVVVPTYNEEKNIINVYQRVSDVFNSQLSEYSYEIMFVDNLSTDGTRNIIEMLAQKDKRVKAIFNAKNFGYVRSHYYALLQVEGD
jgi:glycosyltransferase involved in cell wall biosynthesis